jgi:hypothetical protein
VGGGVAISADVVRRRPFAGNFKFCACLMSYVSGLRLTSPCFLARAMLCAVCIIYARPIDGRDCYCAYGADIGFGNTARRHAAVKI